MACRCLCEREGEIGRGRERKRDILFHLLLHDRSSCCFCQCPPSRPPPMKNSKKKETRLRGKTLSIVTVFSFFLTWVSCPVGVRDRAFNDQRYLICDKKLASLGWEGKTSWKDGLTKTIRWYLENGFSSYWQNSVVENALQAHPGKQH